MSMDKESLRILMKERIKAFPSKQEESRLIRKMIESSPLWQDAETILAFYPLSSEPDIKDLLSDSRVLLPYIDKGKMHFSPSRNLKRSALGFMEPEHIEGEYGKALMLVPLLGFNGLYRLGRGGGYYDRYIAENRDRLTTAGVAFSVSFCPGLKAEEHDEKLDLIFSTEV